MTTRLTILGGIPGSGKSTLRSMKNADIVFEPDAHYDEGDGLYTWTEDKKNRAWGVCYREFARWLHGCGEPSLDRTAIFDGVFLNPMARLPAIHVAKALGATIEMLFIDAPLALCLERNATRTPDRRVPERVIAAMYASRSLPTMKEGFDFLHILRPLKNEEGNWVFHDTCWTNRLTGPAIIDPRPFGSSPLEPLT